MMTMATLMPMPASAAVLRPGLEGWDEYGREDAPVLEGWSDFDVGGAVVMKEAVAAIGAFWSGSWVSD